MNSRKHIVLGTGVLGLTVARMLAAHGVRPVLASRSGRRVGGWSVLACDAGDPAALAALLDAPATLYVCAAPPVSRWDLEFPRLAEGIAGAVPGRNVDIVLADSVCAYGHCKGSFVEGDPARPCNSKGRARMYMAERVLSLHGRYGVRATVVRAATFFGPGVTKSSVSQAALAGALAGRIVHVPGDPGMAHAFTYVPDFAGTMIELGCRDAAFGHCWHTPSHNGRSHLDFLREAAQPADQDVRLRALGPLRCAASRCSTRRWTSCTTCCTCMRRHGRSRPR
ncbi:NAD-dependent epimerase/dehydratase family protein [Pseudoduganella flava]|uniref:NAD-dependent epimerase/dehydratase family protein n=1 Tax=Pseudoduganella flava TaxID=871742 RepID=A0ABX6FMW1_9BURK|nr:NAD-dependent epimerase/dehydratase family protein [Pseudoduganella flava]QGZ37778.1 NAD-dependent epimerase/dehydratase family protein [Pseudoduganella flava]